MNNVIILTAVTSAATTGTCRTNGRKYLSTAFIRALLKKYSSPANPLKLTDIKRLLLSEYNLELDRKTISRVVGDMGRVDWNYRYVPGRGAWYDVKYRPAA